MPETHYAKARDGVSIAYQVVGDAPRDLVLVPGWVSHLEAAWDEPSLARFFERLASFSRLILFDKRGTGLSDRVPESELPTLETRMEDVLTVCGAAGSEHAALLGISEGGPMCALFAATHPDRTTAIVLFGSYARRLQSADFKYSLPKLVGASRLLNSASIAMDPRLLSTLASPLAEDIRSVPAKSSLVLLPRCW